MDWGSDSDVIMSRIGECSFREPVIRKRHGKKSGRVLKEDSTFIYGYQLQTYTRYEQDEPREGDNGCLRPDD